MVAGLGSLFGGGGPEAPEDRSVEAVNAQGKAYRNAQLYDTMANRPRQDSPMGDTVWTKQAVHPVTGKPYDSNTPQWLPYEESPYYRSDITAGGYRDRRSPYQGLTWDRASGSWRYQNPDYVPEDEIVHDWTQTTTLKPEYQAWSDQLRNQSMAESRYRRAQAQAWGATGGGVDLGQFGTTSPTLTADSWRQFGTTSPTVGVDDWREFGMPDSTIGADDWRQFGMTNPTIGADDWRQFGTSTPVITPGTYDERFGNTQDAYRSEFGDHDMGPGDWNYIDYEPSYIRDQAYDYQYQSDVNRLDPMYETQLAELQTQMRAQGLQPGDQQWNSRMNAFNNAKNDAYEQARLNAMSGSRAEAAMLWDQEMARSEQKNMYHQADIDNAYRARQANIGNYLSGREMDMRGYLDYSNAAFQQDMAARQQQLDANLQYGREAWGQDFQERMRQQQANLDYGQTAYQQDYMRAQADRQANLDYAQAAYLQDFQAREAQRAALLNYGNAAFGQDLQSRQQQIDAALNNRQLEIAQFNAMNPSAGVQAVTGIG